MKDTYIKAALKLLNAGESADMVLVNMQQVMNKKGHGSLYTSVLRGLLSKLEQQKLQSLPKVVVATENDLVVEKISSLLKELGSEQNDYTTIVDSTVVGGLKVSYNYKMIDQSYKTKLKNLYQSIVKKTN